MTTIVLEFGSVFLRGGVAGESGPRFIVPSIVGASRLLLFESLSALFLKYLPVKLKECRILVIEKIFSSTSFRNDLFTVLLRDMQVLEVSVQPDLVLPSLTICSSSVAPALNALVIDIGETQCRCIAIAHGRPLIHTLKGKMKRVFVSPTHSHTHTLTHSLTYTKKNHHISVSSIGMKQASAKFQALLEKQMGSKVDANAARQLFEMLACAHSAPMPMPPDIDVPSSKGVSNTSFVVPAALRIACLKSLLTGKDDDDDDDDDDDGDDVGDSPEPAVAGQSEAEEFIVDEAGGSSGILVESLKACNHDVRRLVSMNIVFCGGGAAVPNIAEATCLEATRQALTNDNLERTIKQLVLSSPNQKLVSRNTPFVPSSLAWIGGSLFASIRSNDAKFVRLESFRNQRKSQQTSENSSGIPDKAEAMNSAVLECPDWMSLDETSRLFFSFQKKISGLNE